MKSHQSLERIGNYPPLGASVRTDASLQRIGNYPLLVLVTIHRIRMVFKADTIPILIHDRPCVIHRGILVDHRRRRLQHVYEKHAEKESDQEGQEL
jgi:hypothetical protein